MNIHPTALVSPEAVIDKDVTIGPYSIIGPEVKIGKETTVGPHVVIEGPTEIGTHNQIFQFAAIGAVPQDLKFKGEKCKIIIGNYNVIREFVTIHRATSSDIAMTSIGNHNLLMAYCHIAHNCKLGNNIVISNASQLAGHIHIEDYAIVSGLTGIHQFCRIGCHAIISGASAVTQDVPPYVMAAGNRAKMYGLNLIGLKRRGFSPEAIAALKTAYRILFRSGLLLSAAIERVRVDCDTVPEVNHFIEFIEQSERGICR